MTDKLQVLRQRIEARSLLVAVVGMGYVGLPVACRFAQAGFSVIGLDVEDARVAKVNQGICPIEGIEPGLAELVSETVATGRLRATTDPAALAEARVALIAVQTPVDDETSKPVYRALRSALKSVGSWMQAGTLVVIESTLAPGTMNGLVRPLLETTSGLTAGTDFWVGHCPERVMPGKLLHNLSTCDRVVGGMTPEVAGTMVALYRFVVSGELDPTDLLTAELVKTGENAYRDVNIAFANEMALVCEALGADVYKVRALLNKSPGRNMLMPGAGVGGHCIPKDSWLLVANVGETQSVQLIPTARAVNDNMPLRMLALLTDALTEAGKALRGARVVVMGYAYLENSDDTRNTPSAVLVEGLRRAGADVVVHDPFVQPYTGDWEKAVRDADAAVFMVAHDLYRAAPLEKIRTLLRTPVLVDGRRVFDPQEAARCGLVYRCVGIGADARS